MNITELDNGASVLAFTQTHPGGNGYRPHGVALCYWSSSLHPYVTWTVFLNDEGTWSAEQGHYFMNKEQAVMDYFKRVNHAQ